MKKVSIEDFKNAIDTMLNGYIDGVSYLPLGKTDDDKTIAIVIGWQDGYGNDRNGQCDGEKWQVKYGDNLIFTLCAKVAINIDDLQCDYNFDWYMPSDEDGDIYDTDTALTGDYKCDLEWLLGEAKEMIKLMKKGVLTI